MKNKLRNCLVSLSLAVFLLSSVAISAGAQDTVDSVLKPPKGSQVAIVVFEDLQCPMCRRTAPLVEQASKTYKIPVIRHDFPLPMHNWSYQAAIFARFFDSHSKSLGNEFRDYCFENQLDINPQTLRAMRKNLLPPTRWTCRSSSIRRTNLRPRSMPTAIWARRSSLITLRRCTS